MASSSSIDKKDDVLLSDYEKLQKAYLKLKEQFEMTLQQNGELMKQNIELTQKNKDLLQKNQQLQVSPLPSSDDYIHATETVRDQHTPSLSGIQSVVTLNSLHDDNLRHVMKFVGENCYIPLALTSKRCYELFWTNFLPKKTFLYGFAPMHVIKERPFNKESISKAVVCYGRLDILDWLFDLYGQCKYEPMQKRKVFSYICLLAIAHGRLNFLRCFFQSAPSKTIEYLKRDSSTFLCECAIAFRQLEILKYFREEAGCEWDGYSRLETEKRGFDEILRYLDENNCPQYGEEELERYEMLQMEMKEILQRQNRQESNE